MATGARTRPATPPKVYFPPLHLHASLLFPYSILPSQTPTSPNLSPHAPLTAFPPTDKLNTDLTGDKNVQAIQGGIAEGVGGQLSSGGLLGGVGDMTSKEGVNRAERGDPGLDPKELEKLNAQKKQEKGWTETLSMGYLGGSK